MASKTKDTPGTEKAKELDPSVAGKLTEDSPTTTAGQVHPAVGNPAPVTQEGRDIRDGSQHVQAAITKVAGAAGDHPGGGGLSEIQRQKLDSHPAVKELVGKGTDNSGAVEAMKKAQSDQEREAIARSITALDASGAVALLREPEDPNADPVRDRPAPEYRTDEG